MGLMIKKKRSYVLVEKGKSIECEQGLFLREAWRGSATAELPFEQATEHFLPPPPQQKFLIPSEDQ